MRSILDRAFPRLACLLVASLMLASWLPLWAAAPLKAQTARLALVVGVAEYGETKHPTAVADAGLVAETLKAAGFEVIGGANLSQGEFRALARTFLDRAQQLPREGIVAVYLAGLGVQDEGESYFLPAGARLGQRADLAIEAIRLADYLRALADLPVAARLFMADAAYLHPLTYLAVGGGRGLALSERQGGLLFALNQSPGQSAGLPRTHYGHYAMALAEAFNEPGLDLEAVFQRVRLRVHDLSGGAETPWHVSGIGVPLILNRAAGTPETSTLSGVPVPVAPSRPAIASGPEEAYAAAVEIDTIAAYEEFLRAYPDHALARKVRAMIAARREAGFWQKTRRANSERAYWTYLRHYPKGPHAAEARRRLDRLSASLTPPSDFVMLSYDDLPPPPPEEVVVFEEVVVEDRWEEISPPYAAPPAYLPPPPLALIEAPPPPPPSSSYLKVLPVVPVAIGAAILAHRVWKRPEPVRPRFAPPPGSPLAGRPSFGEPARPGFPPGAIRPAQGAPGGQPPLRPGAIPQPGQQGVPAPQTGVVSPAPNIQPLPGATLPGGPGRPLPGQGRPIQPGTVPPATGQPGQTAPPPAIGAPQGPPRPGNVVPLRPGPSPSAVAPLNNTPNFNPAGANSVGSNPSGARPPGNGPRPIVVTPPNAPGSAAPPRVVPPAGTPVIAPPSSLNPPSVAVPNRPLPPNVRPVRPLQSDPGLPRGGPPAYRPPPPAYRPPPPGFNPGPATATRQNPTILRQAPQAAPPPPRPQPQILRQPPPPAPPPQARQAPPPQVRQAPPPQVQRPAPPPAACTPDLRAQRRC